MDAFNPHSAGQYIGNYRNSFSGGCGIRRESSDSGYLMSLPESRRDSEVDGFNALGYRSGVPADLRRDSEDFFQQQLKVSYILRQTILGHLWEEISNYLNIKYNSLISRLKRLKIFRLSFQNWAGGSRESTSRSWHGSIFSIFSAVMRLKDH